MIVHMYVQINVDVHLHVPTRHPLLHVAGGGAAPGRAQGGERRLPGADRSAGETTQVEQTLPRRKWLLLSVYRSNH